MNEPKQEPASDAADVADRVPPHQDTATEGLNVRDLVHESPQRRMDEIEMIGEEAAAGYTAAPPADVSAGMRYLHSSRTIHQLVTDRNRAVGLFLAVATLMWTASTALYNASPSEHDIFPLATLRCWSMPFTFGVLTVLAVLVDLLLVRTRIGLIYEVAKMNVLLGLPIGRVKRINPLSIFFIMQLIISLAGGVSAALFAAHLLYLSGMRDAALIALTTLIGLLVAAALIGLYIISVLQTTTEAKLQGGVDGTQPQK